jgi:ABC-type transport system involved in multi-copper enzyme maturation permease subunit
MTKDEAEPAADGASIWARAWNAIEDRLVALTDRANPILVKESRQALKSRQFVVTFLIVLVACWIVSFAVVADVGPQIYYAAAGPTLLIWYYGILCIPLALIVPFSAFRSLAAEQEENTYDLLSITTLSSRQIITGKLVSATVQMVVYLCAVSPCIAFTFLLRGVDAIMLAVLLCVAVLGSLGLSVIALLVGAVAKVRSTQVVISVALVLGLAGACLAGIALGFAIIEEGSAVYRDPELWLAMFALLTLYVTTFGLVHAAAAAQIAFVSENRSSPLRWWMIAQQACFCGWVGGAAYAIHLWNPGVNNEYASMMVVAGGFAAAYWYFMGSMLTGEWPHLSRRVQRSLPQSTMGRALLSLFNPGPGAGYLFAVANLTMLLLAGLIVVGATSGSATTWLTTEAAVFFLILAWSYVVAFLGVGRLIISTLRRWIYVPMAAAFLLHFLLIFAAIMVPTVIQMTSRELRNSGYTLLQMSNPIWTLGDLLDDGVAAVRGDILILVIPAAALIALILNMRSVATELLYHRIAPPVRVAEEEAQLHPVPAPKPSSPWETEEPEPVGRS